jgi:hypothetical protein
MPKDKRILVKELAWSEVRDRVAHTCKDLCNIIDNISPGNEFTVFRALYPFGKKIIEKNLFHLPADAVDEIDANIKNKLNYHNVPLGIITDNTAEVFFDADGKIFSHALLDTGLEIGVDAYFNCPNNFSMTAGARSLYMLPKISETQAHKKLKKKFGITAAPPKHLYDHWQVFSEIAQSEAFPAEWYLEIIFLSDKWIDAIKNDSAWSKLAMYLNQTFLRHSSLGYKKIALDLVWETFVKCLNNKPVKFDPYIVDTFKHIINISTGALPGISPSGCSEKTGPLKNIQMIYENHKEYGLDDYIATIMHPSYFSINKPEPVYYSLQVPALLETLPRSKKITSVIDNIRELSELFNCFLSHESRPWSKLMIGNTPLEAILKDLQIDYFHGDMFAYGDLIKSSLKMPEFDSRLEYNPTNNKNRIFASNSSFLKGCVRIANKSAGHAGINY